MKEWWLTCLFALLYSISLGFVAYALGEGLDLSMVPLLTTIGVLSGLVAVCLGFNTRAFDKNSVDLIYYSVAIIGVLVYFWQETAIREVRAVDTHIENKTSNLAKAEDRILEFDKETAELESLVEEQADLAKAIRTQPGPTLTAIREAEIETTVNLSAKEALACAMATGDPHFDLTGRFDNMDRHLGKEFHDISDKETARLACDHYRDVLNRRRDIARNIPISLNALTESPSRFDQIGIVHVPAGGKMMTVSAVIDILSGKNLLSGRPKERVDLVNKVSTAKTKLDEAIQSRDTDIKAAKKGVPRLVWNLRYHYWPYVLIWLLSLKLARSR